MTEEQINIAVAEACGWKKLTVPLEDDLGPIGDMTVTKWKRPSNPHGYVDPTSSVPNYCNNLNAMHEAEKTLAAEQEAVYVEALDRVTWEFIQTDARYNAGRLCVSELQFRATARQRAEAFLRTLGKWEEPS